MFYPNNLLNQFLFEHFPAICNTPVCDCNESVQSLFHVAFECNVKLSNNNQAIYQLITICNFQDNFKNLCPEDFSSLFSNYSKDENFMSLLVKCIYEFLPFLKCNITLPQPVFFSFTAVIFVCLIKHDLGANLNYCTVV